MRSAGLIYGSMVHHIDHVAVLCDCLKIPLIVTEERVAELVQSYYPNVNLLYKNYLEVAHDLVHDFDTIISSLPRPMFDDIFFLMQTLQGKHIKTVWMPHGNSDKENSEGLLHEKVALVYGQKMVDAIQAKNISLPSIKIGNFRYAYHQHQKRLYDLPDKIILYAPTWQDSENSTSFFDATPFLIKNLPPNTTLVIKPHPNLLPLEMEKHPRIHILHDFPPIYPILERTAIYIGDTSSIGYDFLTFNRPMFFLNQNQKKSPLMRCGVTIEPADYANIFKIIQNAIAQDSSFTDIRKEIYTYNFGEDRPWQQIQEEILKIL